MKRKLRLAAMGAMTNFAKNNMDNTGNHPDAVHRWRAVGACAMAIFAKMMNTGNHHDAVHRRPAMGACAMMA